MHSWIASFILFSNSGIVLACVWHPRNAGADATNIPSSSRSIRTKKLFLFMIISPCINDRVFSPKSQGVSHRLFSIGKDFLKLPARQA
jgi:hypothetical protein